jgi:DNA-binding beta-propeller fold protein YncE
MNKLLFSINLTIVLAGSLTLSGWSANQLSAEWVWRNTARQDSSLQYIGLKLIPSSKWIKSVQFNSKGTKLYTLNLENMSVDEFDRATGTIARKFTFLSKRAPGWDYQNQKAISSFADKPVESCFSQNDKILWVSLHNAGGIVAIPMDSLEYKGKMGYPTKTVRVYNSADEITDTVNIPFVRTGDIPKVITKSTDGKLLMVSNWQSGTVSVLRTNDSLPPYAKKITDVPVGLHPRGMYANAMTGKAFVGIMGGNSVSVIDIKTLRKQRPIPVIDNPRHVTADSTGHLFISFNTLSKIACIDPVSGRTLFSAATAARPRSIALSADGLLLFVTCYEGNQLQIFRVNSKSFKLIYSIACSGKPIGIDLYETTTSIEAWVCTYMESSLKVFTFMKVGKLAQKANVL